MKRSLTSSRFFYRSVALLFGLSVGISMLAYGSLTVTPGIHFVPLGHETEIRVDVECPDMAFLTIDIELDGAGVGYVAGSADYNGDRVTPSGVLPVFPETDDGRLRFQAENLGFTAVSAGAGWVFSFRLRGLTAGATSLAPEVVLASTIEGYTPNPITVSSEDRVTVFEVTGLPEDPTREDTATITVGWQESYVTQYKYRLSEGPWSGVRDPETPILLTGLAEFERHTLDIIVGDAEDNWQSSDAPFRHSWTIDPSVPDNPELDASVPPRGTPFNIELEGGLVALTWTLEAGHENHSYAWSLDTNAQSPAPSEFMGTNPPAALTAEMFTAGDADYYLHLRTNSEADGSGVWSPTVQFGPFMLDTTPPSAGLAAPPPEATSSRSMASPVIATGPPRNAVVAYRYRLNDGPLSAETSVSTSISLSNLTPNVTHTLRLFGKDIAGNWQEAPTVYEWLVDRTDPILDALVTDPAVGTWFNAASEFPYEVTVLDTDPGTDTLSGIDGYAWTLSRDPGDLPTWDAWEPDGRYLPDAFEVPAVEGDHFLFVRVFDKAGNYSHAAYGPWRVDTVPPAPPEITGIITDTGVSDSDGITKDQTLVLIGTAEAHASVALTRLGVGALPGSAAADGDGNWAYDYTTVALPEGQHQFTATTTDAAGNTSASSEVYTVTIDLTPPTVTLATVVPEPTNMSPIPVVMEFSEDVFEVDAASLEVVNGAVSDLIPVEAHRVWAVNLVPAADGEVSLSVPAGAVIDAAGNGNTASTLLTRTFDATPPDVAISAPAPDSPVNGSAVVALESDEMRSPELSVDGLAWTPAESGVTTLNDVAGFADLDEGMFTLHLRDTDAAGNVGTAAVALLKNTVPPTLPAVSIASDNAEPSLAKPGDTVTISFSASETIAIPTVILAGAAAQTAIHNGGDVWTASREMTVDDAEGQVAFSITFEDLAGNAGAVVTVTADDSLVIFDRTPPEVEIIAPTGAVPVNDSAVIHFTTDGTGPAELSVDGGVTWTAAESGSTTLGDVAGFAALPDGGFALHLRDRDAAGNIGMDTGDVLVKDTVPPAAVATWLNPATVVLEFTKEVTEQSVENVSFTPSLDITDDIPDGNRWYLITQTHAPGTEYVIAAPTITDLAGNPLQPHPVVITTPGFVVLEAVSAQGVEQLVLGELEGATDAYDEGLDALRTDGWLYIQADSPGADHDDQFAWDFRAISERSRWRVVCELPHGTPVTLQWQRGGLDAGRELFMRPVGGSPAGEEIVDMKDGAAVTYESPFTVDIIYAASVERTLNLSAGWNLVGVPLIVSRSLDEIFVQPPTTAGFGGSVWTWFGGHYRRVSLLDSPHPSAGAGYWVYSDGGGVTAPFTGVIPDKVIELEPGWNLMSPPVEVVTPLHGRVVGEIWYWDGDAQAYRAVPDGGTLAPDKGYWLFLDGDEPLCVVVD